MDFAATIVVGGGRGEDPVIGPIGNGSSSIRAIIKADSQGAGVASEDFAIVGDLGEESGEAGHPIQSGYCI